MLQRFQLRTSIVYIKKIKITIDFEVEMNSWLKKINMTSEEKTALEMWCENIGYDRYKRIYEMAVA